MYRVKGNGMLYSITVYMERSVTVEKGQRITFYEDGGNIEAYAEQQNIGAVKAVKEANVIRHILQQNNMYYAHVEAVNEHVVAIALARPTAIIRTRETITINTSHIQSIKYDYAPLKLNGQSLTYVAHDKKSGNYYLFNNEPKAGVLVLTWEHDQLFAQKEEPLTYKPEQKEELLLKAKVFTAPVVFYDATVANELVTTVEAPFPSHFETDEMYLKAWMRYMEFEKQKLQQMAGKCAALHYISYNIDYGKVQFMLKPQQAIEQWAQYKGEITAEVESGGKHYRLGALRAVSSTFLEADLSIEDITHDVPFAKNGVIKVSTELEEVALRRRDRALKKTLENICVISDLGKLLSEPATVAPLSARTYTFPLAQVPTLVNGRAADKAQEEAITAALNTNDLVLIQGPPGTGKTSVIQTIMKCLLELGQKDILLTSYQHLAVDNAIAGLTEHGILSHRFGGETHERELFKSYEKIVANIVAPIREEQMLEYKEQQFIEQLLVDLQQYERMQLTAEAVVSLQSYIERLLEDTQLPLEAFWSLNTLLDAIPTVEQQETDLPLAITMRYEQLKKTAATLQKAEHIQQWSQFIEQSRTYTEPSQHTRTTALVQTLKPLLTKARLFKDNATLLQQIDEVLQQLVSIYDGTFTSQRSAHNNSSLKDALRTCIVALQHIEAQSDEVLVTKEEEILQRYAQQLQANPLDLAQLIGRYANVKGVTCQQTVAQRHGMYDAIFDAVIIDEAARANPLDLLIPMTLGKKIILVGDHKQLPHILEPDFEREEQLDEDTFQELYKDSLFERLYNGLPSSKKVMLKRQFRMHAHIGQLVSQLFYPEGLAHGLEHDALQNNSGMYDGHHVAWVDVPVSFGGEEGAYKNKHEALAIIEMVKQLLTDAKNIGKISVITFYNEQVKLLTELLSHNGFTEQVTVGTVDAFQGKESDIVLLSTVRSNTHKSASRALGFLRSPNRLNVALSRARSLLIIVGDYETLRKEPMFETTYNYVKEWGIIDEYCRAEHI